MARAGGKRVGRPIKKAKGASTVIMGLRVPPALKDDLHRAALASGSSLSDEIERRLRRTLDIDEKILGSREMQVLGEIINLVQGAHGGGTWQNDAATCRILKAMMLRFFWEYGADGKNIPKDWEVDDAGKYLMPFLKPEQPKGDTK